MITIFAFFDYARFRTPLLSFFAAAISHITLFAADYAACQLFSPDTPLILRFIFLRILHLLL